ncbi:hypothetical protein LQZ18_10085, partial [Lachnospiraceae bacterium ZAX-1]
LIRRTSSANADLVLFLFYRKVCSVNLNSAGRIALRRARKILYSVSNEENDLLAKAFDNTAITWETHKGQRKKRGK